MHAKHALYTYMRQKYCLEISGIEPETSCMLSIRNRTGDLMHAKHALYTYMRQKYCLEISGIEPETSCMLSMRSTN
jgi:hypothetical protein